MIDTSKYEGHSEGDEGIAWRIVGDNFVMNDEAPQPDGRFIAYVQPQNDGTHKVMGFSDADANLIADAPLLLEEVKRLREWKAEVERICRTMNGPSRDTALFIMTNEVEEE